MDFGGKIKFLRKNCGLTQSDLARKLNITPQAVSKWENNKGKPDLMHIIPLSYIFGVNAELLLHSLDPINAADNAKRCNHKRFIIDLDKYNNLKKTRLIKYKSRKKFIEFLNQEVIDFKNQENTKSEIIEFIYKFEMYAEEVISAARDKTVINLVYIILINLYICTGQIKKAEEYLVYLSNNSEYKNEMPNGSENMMRLIFEFIYRVFLLYQKAGSDLN